MSDALLTVTEVAEQTGIPRRTLLRWITDGKLVPAGKLPGERGAYLLAPVVAAALAEATP